VNCFVYEVVLLACSAILGTCFTTHLILIQGEKCLFWHC